MSKKRKITILFVISIFFLSFVLSFGGIGPCDCDETYMGQPLTAYKCTIIGGKIQSRVCYYGGAEKL